MFNTKFRNLLLEVVLDLLNPILDLQVNLRPLKMVPNNFPFTKTYDWTPKWKRLISESSLSGERGVELRRCFRSLEPNALNPRLPIPQSIVSFILLAPRYLGVPAVANK